MFVQGMAFFAQCCVGIQVDRKSVQAPCSESAINSATVKWLTRSAVIPCTSLVFHRTDDLPLIII